MRVRIKPGRDEGVSTVLGAILMFGLLVLTLVTIQAKFVPVWDEDREAQTMQEVSDQMRQIKSDLDRQAANDTAGPVTDPLTLHKEAGFRFFGGNTPGAQLSFVPAPVNTGVKVESSKPVHVLRQGGQSLFGLSDTWTSFTTGDIPNVAAVQNLRVRVDLTPSDLPSSDPAKYADADSSTLDIFGAADDVNPLGWATFSFRDFSSELAIQVQVYDATGTEISTAQEAYFQQSHFHWMYFDLLSPELLVPQIFGSGVAPYRLHLVQNHLQAAYQISFTDASVGGVAGNGGVAQPSFTATFASGHLVLASQNQRFVPQTYTLEHGAVVLSQPDGSGTTGSVMAGPPAFQVASSPSNVAVTWTIPALSGDAVTRGGSTTAVVATPTTSVQETWILASQLTFTVPTSYGSAWCDQFNTLLSNAGLSSAGLTPQYTPPAATSAQCSFTLFGPVSDPSDTTEDIFLRLRASDIDLALTLVG